VPYLRVFSPYIPAAQKRLIVQKLIEITSRALAEDRHRINIQFILLPHIGSVSGFGPAIPRDADFFLEVNHNGLTEEKKRAFAEEVKPMLTQVLGARRGSRFTRMLGIRPGISRQVALLFQRVQSRQIDERVGDLPGLERRAA
jgi:phenylpyruvate tautomerase PptA (4-oxalocrotonate tautomerase family)